MDRDRFETSLDVLIAAHGRKVRAGIDAACCGTRLDWIKSHEADEAYLDARDAFLSEVFAPPPAAPPPVVFVVGWEERHRGGSRGRPIILSRGVEIRIVFESALYTFAARADDLTLSPDAVNARDSSELHSPDFDPLCPGHSVRFRGVNYTTTERGPENLVKMAIEACRAAALRLHAHSIDYFTAMQAWPEGVPAFAEIVKGEAPAVAAA
jgi:hypothetical protein